jgi:U1 small nuclear ribonucleoprotein
MKAMFIPDTPLEFKPPVVKRRMPPYSGIAAFVNEFEDADVHPPLPRPPFEDVTQRKQRLRLEAEQQHKAALADAMAAWSPAQPPKPTNGEVTGDAYKTLFVARVSYDTTTHKLRREFEQFGAIKTLRLVQDLNGECRGYAFIE